MPPATAKKPASQELVVREEPNINLVVPDYIRADDGKNFGFEVLDNSDFAVPRLKIMQGLSPEKEQYSFLKNGAIFHSGQEIELPQPLLAVVVYVDKRYILWRPRDAGGGILARADDAKHWFPANESFTVRLDKKDGGATVTWTTKPTVLESGLADWGTQNPADSDSPPAATLMYNYLLAFPDNPKMLPAVLTLQRTAVKAAQRLNLKFRAMQRPTFQSVVRFRTFLDHAGANDFYSVNTELAGNIWDCKKWCETDVEPRQLDPNGKLYQDYRASYLQVAKEGLQIKDEEGLQGDAADALNVDGIDALTEDKVGF